MKNWISFIISFISGLIVFAKFGGVTKTASRHLNELVDEGILDREGEKKGTRYFLKE